MSLNHQHPTMRSPIICSLLSAAVVTMGCAPSSPPEETAERFVRAEQLGDRLTMRSLLSATDSADLASDELRSLNASAFSQPDAGSPGSSVDSSRIVFRGADSAVAVVFTSEPNWATVGGRYSFDGGATVDRALDTSTVSSLTRVTGSDTIELVRERGNNDQFWRVVWRARFRYDRDVLVMRAVFLGGPQQERAEATRAVRELYLRHGRSIEPEIDSMLRASAVEAAYADSIEFRIDVSPTPPLFPGGPTREITGWVRNRSHRAISSVWFELRFASGETTSAHASDIEPGGTKKPLGWGNWTSALVSRRITSITLASP